MITVRDIWRIKSQREKERTKIWNVFVRRITERIKQQVRHNPDLTYIVYTFPPFEWGMPLYDPTQCMEYLRKEFEKAGFETHGVNTTTIWIGWTTKPHVSLQAGFRPTVYDNALLDTLGR